MVAQFPNTAADLFAGRITKTSSWIKNNQNRTILEISLTFITMVFFGWFALRPTVITITELLKDRQTLQDVVILLNQKIDNVLAAQYKLGQVQPKLPLLDESLPPKPFIAEALGQIEVIALASNLTIDSLVVDSFPINADKTAISQSQPLPSQPGKPPQVKDWLEIPLNITAIGTYESFRQFSAQLSGMRRVVIIDTFTITQSPQLGGLEFKLTGRLIYY